MSNRARCSTLFLGFSLLLLVDGRAVAAAGGERHLGPAALYLAVHPQAAYEGFAEVKKLLRKRLLATLPMLGFGLSRVLGFDPLTPDWIDAAGLDASAPIWASLFSLEPGAVRARLARIEQAARRELGSASRKGSFRPADVAGPFAWIRHRLVLSLKDEAKARSFLAATARSLGGRATLLLGKARTEVAPGLASTLRLTAAEAAALADALQSRGVALVSRLDSNLFALYRIKDGAAVVDLVAEVVGLPETPGAELGRGLLASLALPRRPGLALEAKAGLARRLFTDDAAAAALVVARPFLAMAAEEDLRSLLAVGTYGFTPDGFKRQLGEVQACRKALQAGAAVVGDLGFQLRGDRRQLHARGLWVAPAQVARAFAGASARRELIDATEWRAKVVGLLGLAIEIGPLVRGLPRGGLFALDPKLLERHASRCPALAGSVGLLGGWTGMLGVMKAEAKRSNEPLALLLEHGRNGVVLLRDLATLARPNVIAQVGVAQSGAAKMRESLAKLAPELARAQPQTFGGKPTIVYPYLGHPLAGYSLGVTDQKSDGLLLTLVSNRWELQTLLQQPAPGTRVLPSKVLAFAYGQLPKLLTAISQDASFRPIGKMLRDGSQRVGELGANLSLAEGILQLEARVELR